MELRKDYILDRWVFLASERKTRPKEFAKEKINDDPASCRFCPGNEHLTPNEIGRVKKGNSWLIRWFPNKFPAVDMTGNPGVRTDNTFFTFSSAFGMHEIIADSPSHDSQLWDLPDSHLAELFKVYFSRIEDLSKVKGINYVSVFKNYGRDAGASLVHSHSQVAATAFLPTAVLEEASSSKRFGSCPYCRIIQVEKDSLRKCFENNSFAAFCPYASRFNYEVWVFPKMHVNDFTLLGNEQVKDLVSIMRSVLGRLKSINAPHNYFLHYSRINDLHAHIEITPRTALWAGFEFLTGSYINSVTPEDAAAFYRGEQ